MQSYHIVHSRLRQWRDSWIKRDCAYFNGHYSTSFGVIAMIAQGAIVSAHLNRDLFVVEFPADKHSTGQPYYTICEGRDMYQYGPCKIHARVGECSDLVVRFVPITSYAREQYDQWRVIAGGGGADMPPADFLSIAIMFAQQFQLASPPDDDEEQPF